MSQSSFFLTQGNLPVIISMPHNGVQIPDDIAQNMEPTALLSTDTDWYMDELYEFAQAMGIWIIKPKYSRYVIDLNRDPKGVNLYPGANSTELCPTTDFDMKPLYLPGHSPDETEINRRITHFWQPYHQVLADTLSLLRQQYGTAILLDAHSIRSQVPRFFEGQLPDFNFGNGDGVSCAESLIARIQQLDLSPYSSVINGRFKGGYITRAYGNPKRNIHSIQLELSQRTYLHEPSNKINPTEFAQVQLKLKLFVNQLVQFASNH